MTTADLLARVDRFAVDGPADDPTYLRGLEVARRFRAAAADPRLGALANRVAAALEAGLHAYETRRGDAGRKGDWNATFSGRRFWLLDPRPDEVEPADIAWGLGGIARFNAATDGEFPFTVAQHCVVGSYFCPYPLEFLLHDAPEAYTGDVVSPVKTVMAGDYKAIEAGVAAAVMARFGVAWTDEVARAVKRTDLDMQLTENDRLRPGRPINRPPAGARLLGVDLTPWPAAAARAAYARRLTELCLARAARG